MKEIALDLVTKAKHKRVYFGDRIILLQNSYGPETIVFQ